MKVGPVNEEIPELRVTMRLEGELCRDATGYGDIKVNNAEADAEILALKNIQGAGFANNFNVTPLISKRARMNRDAYWFYQWDDFPEDRIQFTMIFSDVKGADQISSLSGHVVLATGDRPQTVELSMRELRDRTRINRAEPHAELNKAGIELWVQFAEDDRIELAFGGKYFAVESMELLDANNKELETEHGVLHSAARDPAPWWGIECQPSKKPADDAKIRITYRPNGQLIKVPFRLTSIPVYSDPAQNITKTCVITASSQQEGHSVGLMADGKRETYWTPSPDDPNPTIHVDLIEPTQLFSFGVSYLAAVEPKSRLEGSTDGKNWTLLNLRNRQKREGRTFTDINLFHKAESEQLRYLRFRASNWIEEKRICIRSLQITGFSSRP